MERPEYHYPTNTPTLRIPAGYVAIPLKDYRRDIEQNVELLDCLKVSRSTADSLAEALKDALAELEEKQVTLDDYVAFLKPWQAEEFEEFRKERRKKEAEEAKEAENAEAEES